MFNSHILPGLDGFLSGVYFRTSTAVLWRYGHGDGTCGSSHVRCTGGQGCFKHMYVIPVCSGLLRRMLTTILCRSTFAFLCYGSLLPHCKPTVYFPSNIIYQHREGRQNKNEDHPRKYHATHTQQLHFKPQLGTHRRCGVVCQAMLGSLYPYVPFLSLHSTDTKTHP